MEISQVKWPKELVIVRHGQSERNVAKDEAKAAGNKLSYVDAVRDQDTVLTPLGFGQALEVGVNFRSMGDERFDAVLVSPYMRTRQTAEQIVRGLGYTPEIVVEERIREIEFGILDGLTPEGVRAKYPEEVARRQKEGKYWYRPPGGESRPDVALRVHSLLGTLTRDYAGKRVLVVCHSVVVLVFRRLLERWTEAEYLKVDREDDVKNCSVTRYSLNDLTGKLDLDCYNWVPRAES
jgi:broad specificity phosphatase PhoE